MKRTGLMVLAISFSVLTNGQTPSEQRNSISNSLSQAARELSKPYADLDQVEKIYFPDPQNEAGGVQQFEGSSEKPQPV